MPAVIHAHLENLSSKPPIFHLTRKLLSGARRANRDLETKVRYTIGEDFRNLDRNLKTAQVLVTSNDVIRDTRFPRDRLHEAAPQLKLVQVIGAGIERLLPLDWLPSGVKLATASGVHFAKARESLMMALLALNARLPEIVFNQRRAKWDMIFTSLIAGKRLLVIGLGDMGRAAVAAGRALGLKVTGVRRSGKKFPGVDRVYEPRALTTAVRDADFVIVAAPLTDETRNLLSRQVLENAKRGIGIVNVGRAGVVDYAALAHLLKTGHVSGALLDVFDEEPLPPSSPLWATPNVILTPHVTSDDLDGYMRATMQIACENLRRLANGRPLRNIVRPELGY